MEHRAFPERRPLKPWMLAVMVVVMVVALSAGFLFGGPSVGLLAGLAVAGVIVFVAIRRETPEQRGSRRRERPPTT